jgi:DNA replication and repair protein RecF
MGRNTMSEVRSFEPILAEKGSIIVRFRSEVLKNLSEHMSSLIQEISGLQKEFSLKYSIQKNTSDYQEYITRFGNDRERDFSRQYSTFGPHLDDFEFIYDGKPLRCYGSTGQCRLASLCLKLASVRIMSISRSNEPEIVALVDDVTGELDIETKKAFYSVLKKAGQVFFTFTEKPVMDEFLRGSEIFEVSDGKIIPGSNSAAAS